MEKPSPSSSARIIHVSPEGDDRNDGSPGAPFRRIQTAAREARPGDTIRIHAGIYRERIDPPRGGSSGDRRITYEAAGDGPVEVRGSEKLTGWERLEKGIWETRVSNELFGDFNPFAEPIRGDWFLNMGRPHHTANLYFNDTTMHEAVVPEDLQQGFWCARVEAGETVIRANFGQNDPNEADIEMNARPTVFYPSREGINYITVRGLTLSRAATNWAPPTAEQIGAIGTNWSKGWIIEDCTVTHSRCAGIALGKHGDEYDNTSANSAEGYVVTIRRAEERGWCRDNIGGHIVRNNTIAHCEQAGIVGSLGAIFSTITGNEIHDIHVHRLFNGAEQAGIKFHAPIDTLIAGNHIYRTVRAMWMDWMTQGTRITGNLCHDNHEQDLFVEVNHGPFVVDHNLFLSRMSVWSMSQGGAFVHNLFAGTISRVAELGRETPWHPAHSTEIAGITNIRGGDERYVNNLFVRPAALKSARGQLDHKRGAKKDAPEPFANTEKDNVLLSRYPELVETEEGWELELGSPDGIPEVSPISTESLGRTVIAGLPYEDYDATPLRFARDYSGGERTGPTVTPGPFARKTWQQGSIRVGAKKGTTGRAEKIMVV